MSILSTNNKIVRVGDAYSAGSGIDITDRVISVSDDLLNEISAISATVSSVTGDIGSQIDYISGAVDNLSGDIDYISANAGRTYSGIDPIVVNNDENKISATTLQLSAGDNITLTEEGNIVRIDGQAGESFDPTYISAQIDNKLNKSEVGFKKVYDVDYVSGISGKQISASIAASAGLAQYALQSNVAYYDSENHSILNNYYNISSLSSFVNNNSGSWTGGTTYTGDAQGALDEVYVNSGTWNDISALNNKKDFDVQAPLIIAEETISSLKIGISGISADEWNSVYNTVYTGSGSWTGGGGGSVDTVPFVVLSPLTTGFTGDSAYIGLENAGDDFAKNSAFTFNNSYLTGVSGYKVSAYRTYSAYTARNAYTAANAAYAQTAQTAAYDGNGNSLLQTHNDLVSLNEFIQTNSANWGGGSGPTGGNGKVLFHKYYYYDPSNGTQNVYCHVSGARNLFFEAAVNKSLGTPNEMIVLNNGYEVGRVYWTQTSSDEYTNYYSATYTNSYGEIEFSKNGFNTYSRCYMSANGIKTQTFEQTDYSCDTQTNVKFNITGNNITGNILGYDGNVRSTLTSFTGALSDFNINGYFSYENASNYENYGPYFYDLSAEFDGVGGSTVTSGDVLPPGPTGTGNTYALCWNDANGLFWDIR